MTFKKMTDQELIKYLGKHLDDMREYGSNVHETLKLAYVMHVGRDKLDVDVREKLEAVLDATHDSTGIDYIFVLVLDLASTLLIARKTENGTTEHC